jgi:hypothetical protein
VADAAGGKVGAARVGRADTVFVERGEDRVGGKVGVLNGAGCVNWACTVNAAAVNTAFGSSVADALDGRLHAESVNMIAVKIKMLGTILDIRFSSFTEQFYTNADGLILSFVPNKNPSPNRRGVGEGFLHLEKMHYFSWS